MEEKVVGFPQEDKSNAGAFPVGSIVRVIFNGSAVYGSNLGAERRDCWSSLLDVGEKIDGP